jgi:hypothetical protein
VTGWDWVVGVDDMRGHASRAAWGSIEAGPGRGHGVGYWAASLARLNFDLLGSCR